MKDAISLGVGEPDFNTPDHIIQAAKAALDAGHTKYTPSSGLLPLRKAICEKFQKDNGLDYEPSQIIVSNGAKHSIFNVCYAVLDEGDEVIIPAPYWLTYPEVVKVCGGVPKYLSCKKENKYKFSAEELKAAITPKTKMLIFNSPSNPTGAVYTEDEVRAIAKVCEEAGIFVLADEIYEKLCFYDNFNVFNYFKNANKIEIEYVNNLLDDLKRRDFTINAPRFAMNMRVEVRMVISSVSLVSDEFNAP